MLSDTELACLLAGVKNGLRPERAMRKVNRRPALWHEWVKRAERGDPECGRVRDMVERAEAEWEEGAVICVGTGGLQWKGAAWLLERRWPTVYSAEVQARQADASALSDEELDAIIAAEDREAA